MSSESTGLFPILMVLAIMLFAALAWCMVSSCLGRSFYEAIHDLWNMLVMSAQSNARPSNWPRRRNWDTSEELFEMEHRNRAF